MTITTQPTETKLITGEELYAMGDIGSCELIDGRIVEMTPAGGEHGYLELNIARELSIFVRRHKLGWVMTGEVGIFTRRNPDRVRGADVAFISTEQADNRPRAGFLELAPALVVEIISPSDRWTDINDKLEEYFAIGVPWVWLVEPKDETVRVYRSPTEMVKLGAEETITGEGILAEFRLPLAEIFAD